MDIAVVVVEICNPYRVGRFGAAGPRVAPGVATLRSAMESLWDSGLDLVDGSENSRTRVLAGFMPTETVGIRDAGETPALRVTFSRNFGFDSSLPEAPPLAPPPTRFARKGRGFGELLSYGDGAAGG